MTDLHHHHVVENAAEYRTAETNGRKESSTTEASADLAQTVTGEETSRIVDSDRPRGRTTCDCGSGLRPRRCCLLDKTSLVRSEAARHLMPLLERATKAWGQGASDTAERLCLELLELLPSSPDGLWLLSRIRDAENKSAAVEALVGRIVDLHPNHLAATQDIALRFLRRGALAEAERHARNAVRLAPNNTVPHNLLAMVLTDAHQLLAGEYHYRRVLELSEARDPLVLANLAWCLKQQGRTEEARALYEESLALAPDVLQTLLGYARLEEADRRFDHAFELLDSAEALAPKHPGVRLSRAVLHGRVGQIEAALSILEQSAKLQGEQGLGPEQTLEKGRLLDRLGQHEAAFAAFAAGKAMASRWSRQEYRAGAAQDQARRLCAFFTAERLATLPRAQRRRTDQAQPIFVLGFPRSGTTLVEQMLSAHPQIAAGDELPFIHDLAALAPRMLSSPLHYPEALAELWMGDRRSGLDTLRDTYLQRAGERGLTQTGRRWFTDKMPLNETHLGLIGLLFPEAPLIYLIRHPLDVVLSVFSNQLTHGLYCGYALESAARHLALTAELVAHHRAQMTLRLLPVRYEDVVSAPEDNVRRMLTFLGEAFEPACLAPHENTRYARTASYAQVTQPLHDRSVGRWRHYRDQLAPAIRILDPAIERLGYGLE